MTALELFFILLNLIISVAGLSAFALAATVSNEKQEQPEPEVSELGKMNIINLTPHDINLYLASGEVVTYPALNKDAPARAAMEVTNVGFVNVNGQKIPITRNKYGELENVPYPEPNTFFIVSALAAQAAPYRNDLIIPSDPVRNEKNQVIGCRSFSVI